MKQGTYIFVLFNPLNNKLNPICHFLALLGAHPILHVSRISVKRTGVTNLSVHCLSEKVII
jgi:hypothetical protein